MNVKSQYLNSIATALGFVGNRMPHEVARRCESLWLMGVTVKDAIAELLPAKDVRAVTGS